MQIVTAHFSVLVGTRDGWMDDWLFYILYNNSSVISGHWEGDNERLFAMEPCL